MNNKFNGFVKRLVSGLSAMVLFVSNSAILAPITASAEDEDPPAAHTINVFDIDIKSGADYYSSYTPDAPADGGKDSFSDVYVWQADKSDSGHKFVYNIKLSVSGDGNSDNKNDIINTGFIKITIPEHILRLKDDTYGDTVEMPVPHIDQIEKKEIQVQKTDENDKPVIDAEGNPVYETIVEYATDHQFVYDYDATNHEYVIYNIGPVSAGVVYEIPVAYVMEKNTWEYQDMGSSDPFLATVKVNSWEKGSEPDPDNPKTISQTSRKIPVCIDTGAKLTDTVKRASAVLIDADEAAQKFGLDYALDTNYKYTIWTITSDITSVTQKYSVKLEDSTHELTGKDAYGISHTVEGEIVAVKMGNTIFNASETQDYSVSGLTSSGKRTDYVLTRYPIKADGEAEGIEDLDNAPKTAVYSASNDAKVTLTPADGQDSATVEKSTGSFQLVKKDPTWLPPEVSYSSNKWGLYNNGSSRVGNKTNVSSYELNNLVEDAAVSELKYETNSIAHAYGKTITDLNNEITSLIVTDNGDGTFIVNAGTRRYEFDVNNGDTYKLDGVEKTIANSCPIPLSTLNMQRIVGRDIADSYYGQKPLDYIFDDRDFYLYDVNDAENAAELGKDDYHIDSVDYEYSVCRAIYDDDEMEFSAGDTNDYVDDDTQNILEFYVYQDKDGEPVLAGRYNIRTDEVIYKNESIIDTLSGNRVTFSDSADVTGYRIKSQNKYFYVALSTKPSITLKPSDKVKEIVQQIVDEPAKKEQKIALRNSCDWIVMNGETQLLKEPKTGTDYIADIVRTSDINKKALGEKISYKGQDGKTYRSRNDTLSGEYELAWQTKIAETADGVEINGRISNGVPVPQQSGIFYDLLPSHSDIIEGSVNVYVDKSGDINENTASIPASSFEVLDRIDNYNDSGKKLLIIKINVPCQISYTVSYVTVHSHEDIQDYGSLALNTVAYQTGNADIGDGRADDGGIHDVTLSAYIQGLDPENNGAKRFIYAEDTEDILALFPTSSGIYKKVSTQSDPVYRKTGVVYNGETYSYNIRMKNDPSTHASDIAILDSIENYRTVNGTTYNSGLKMDRDWNGTLQSFDLQGIENKMGDYKDDLRLILYTGNDIVDLGDENYSDVGNRKYLLYKILGNTTKAEEAANGLTEEQRADIDKIANNWKAVDWRDPSGITPPSSNATPEEIEQYNNDVKAFMETVTAFIVYTGERYVLPKGDSMSFTVKMQAPDTVTVNGEANVENGVFLSQPKTYNNVYRSFTSTDASNNDTYFYTHYDYTQLEYKTVGTLKFTKRDAETGAVVANVTFNLSGVSDYGTSYDETLISDSNGVVTFKNLERGTYQLIESISDDDHQLDTTPRTVRVDPKGTFTFVTVDGYNMVILDENGDLIKNPDVTESTADVVKADEKGNFSVYNEPRYHADLSFGKVDSLSRNGISGTKFTLTGTSDYNTKYDLTAESDENGNVVFENIEIGTYTLTETVPSDGYLPPFNNVYQVTSTGKRNLLFRITGENVVNAGTEYQIGNIPTAEMNLQKVDSITKDMLSDGKFTLTADSELASTLQNLTDNVSGTGWEKITETIVDEVTGEETTIYKWVQSIDGSNTSNSTYLFRYLPEGSYTLTEDRAPTGYAKNAKTYNIKVVKSSDGKALLIELPETDDMKYIKLEGEDFTETDKENAAYSRLLNDETYEDGKTVVKSWVGGVDGKFPSLHLSSEKPEATAVKVTIGTAFKTLVQNNKANFTGLVKEETLPDGKPLMVDRTGDAADETGNFYAWWDSTDNKVHWYSDANIIYLPRDCHELFRDCKNASFTEIDLSLFSGNKITKMSWMFGGCSNLISVDLSNIKDTPELTTTAEMFNGCSSVKFIHLENWANAPKLENMGATFTKCTSLERIELNSLVATNIKDMHQMLDRGAPLTYAFLGKSIAFQSDATVNSLFRESMAESTDPIIDLSGWDTSNVTNMKEMFGKGTKSKNNVKTIYVSEKWNTDKVTDSTKMFENAISITGGNGTTYDSTKIDKTYARIDKDGQPGYFTYKEAPQVDSSSSSNQGTNTPTNISVEFTNYPNFTKTGSATQTKNTTATADDVGKTSFTFEYVTDNTVVPTSGAEPYEVDETVYLTVNQIVEDGGAYYTVSQKYKYNDTLKAKWTKVGGTAPTQWFCEMKVFNADDEMFAWEDKVTGYDSTADVDSPIKTVGRADKPVITNSTDTPIGSLELSKKLTGDKEKFSRDTFKFKVTMTNFNGTPYNMLPFDDNGVAYFDVKPNAADDDKIIIKGIPAGCTYTVAEVDLTNGYEKVTSTDPSGTIVGAETKTAEIENSIKTTDLTLTKEIELYKKTTANGELTPITDPSDTDYSEWAAQEFTFKVTFKNLVMGQEYSYTIDGVEQSDKIIGSSSSAETVKTITIKGGQTVVFNGIPIGTKYTIEETSEFEETDSTKYSTINDKNADNAKSTGEQVLNAADSVTFTNTKNIDKTIIPETVEVTVNKKWLSAEGKTVHWKTNVEGKVVKFSYDEATDSYIEDPDNGSYIPMDSDDEVLKNFPSFLRVYLGRALKVGEGEDAVYLDIQTGYSSVSLNAKGGWSYTFDDLEKYGEITIGNVTTKCPYVYFVTEIVPIGFSNVNEESEKTQIGTGSYFVATGSEDDFSFTLENKQDETFELSVCKLVTGNLGDKSKDFKFEIEFTSSDGSALVGTGFTMQFTDVYDSTYVRNRTYTLESGKVTVELSHGKKVAFLSLPKGTSYKITELNGDGFAIHSGTYTGDPTKVNSSTLTGGKVQKGELTEDTSYLYLNEMQGDIPTGIHLALVVPVVAAAVIIGYFACYYITKRKKLNG